MPPFLDLRRGVGAFAILSLALAACGDREPLPPLTCASLSLCTQGEATTYYTPELETPTGGAIADGRYRLAWSEADRADRAGVRVELATFELRDGRYTWSGGREGQGQHGTFSTTATSLQLHFRSQCERGSSFGRDIGGLTTTFMYSVRGDTLRLQRTGSGPDGWTTVGVFERFDDPEELCTFVAAVPSTPGESAQCSEPDCSCAAGVDSTLAASACPQ